MLKSLSDLFLSVGVHPVVGGFLLGVAACLVLIVLKRAMGIEVGNASSEELARFRDPKVFHSESSVSARMTFLRDGKEQVLPDHISDQVMQALREGKKIEAIKVFKDATGLGLKESKDLVELLENKIGRK